MSILPRQFWFKFQGKREKIAGLPFQLEHLEPRILLSADVSLSWSAGPDLPAPRSDAVALLAPDNAVYILGGDSPAPTGVPRLAANGTSWQSAPHNIDTQRNDLGAVRSGNKMLLFGGTGNNEGSNEALSYDYLLGDHLDLAKMNTIRYDLGYAADAAGRAYAIGGIGVLGDSEIWSQAERYDPASDTWTSIAPLPEGLHGLSAIGDGNGHIFVFGGSTTLDNSGIQANSYRYDITSDSWTTIAAMPTATRDSAVVMDEDGAIYVLGGISSAGASDAVQEYDPATDAWIAQTTLPEPIYSQAAAYDSLGRIIVAGGFDANGVALDAVYRTQRLNIPQTAPAITSGPVLGASLDRFYTYDVNATGNPNPTYSLVDSPAGMAIAADTGLISWQPVAGQLGVHTVTVRASNVMGDDDQSFDVTVVADTIAPTAPTDFVVDSVTETSVTVSWTASTDAVGVDRYEVSTAVYTGPRFGKRWVYTVVDTVTSTSATVTGLTPLTSKRFSVQAIDAAGNKSARSPRILATTLAAPTLTFQFGAQTTGTVESPAQHLLEIQLHSTANPAATFSLVSGPASMTVDSTTGLVQWTPIVAEMGLQTVTFRATNSVASTDLDVTVDILSDVPQLSVVFNPTTGGERFALAGTLFTAQIHDASQSASTYELLTKPVGMTIVAATGAIAWTPAGTQGGVQNVTVRGTNAGGTTDLTFGVPTLFTAAVTNVEVTGTTLLEPTISWVPPTGEGANLVDSYLINGSATWGVGRNEKTHRVSYTVPASKTSLLMTGLVTGKSYTMYVTPVDAAGNAGLRDAGTVFVSSPALPQVRWTVNGNVGGSSVPGLVIAEQLAQIILTDLRPDPSTMTLVSGPDGLSFDPATNTADWTPAAADVTSGYTTANVTFQATNSVGSVEVVVPMRVFFSGGVRNASTTRNGYNATARWDAPTDNVTSIAGYSITRHWTWSGRPRSVTWTVGNVNSISFALYPTGAVSHKGITITPIDANGNLGVSSGLIRYGTTQASVKDVRLTSVTATGMDAVEISYQIVGDVAGGFDVGFYRSTDAIAATTDEVLDTITINQPADLSPGVHTVTLNIGPGLGKLKLPGAGVAETGGDYYLIAIADPANLIAETDSDPIREDNCAFLSGVYHLADGNIFVQGTDALDTITVSSANGVTIDIDGTVYVYALAESSGIRIRAQGQDDAIDGSRSPLALFVHGGAGNDTLNGSAHNDNLFGDGGMDSLYGKNGRDILDGGAQDDSLYGGGRDDKLWGGTGNDLILGSTGSDLLWGQDGNDVLRGGGGNDVLRGGTGDDKIYGNAGNDSLYGNADQDRLFGGTGDDFMNAGSGALEVMRGDAGADSYEYVGTSNGDRLRLIGNTSTLHTLDRLDANGKFVERKRIYADADDLLLIFAAAGDDEIDVAANVTLVGNVDGGNGIDTCTIPSGWTKSNCE